MYAYLFPTIFYRNYFALSNHSPSQSDKTTSMESMKFLNSALDNDNI